MTGEFTQTISATQSLSLDLTAARLLLSHKVVASIEKKGPVGDVRAIAKQLVAWLTSRITKNK